MYSCRGHASEKPELPAALADTATKIRFLGPPAEAMAALGDKVLAYAVIKSLQSRVLCSIVGMSAVWVLQSGQTSHLGLHCCTVMQGYLCRRL